MQRKILVVLTLIGITFGLITGCSTIPEPTTQQNSTRPEISSTEEIKTGLTGVSQDETLVIYAPASSSSIPVIIAANRLNNIDLQLYTNQAQANTLFLRGEADILVTGLSVGVDLFSNDAPIQMISSYVSGLSYLVTYGNQINSVSELDGQSIYVPFEGSPIEQVIQFLAEREGLTWKSDVTPVYLPFESSIELLKQGTATAVVLPEPNVSLIEDQPNIYISLDLFDEWNKETGSAQGYPQVAAFVQPEWADANEESIDAFNQTLSDAVEFVQKNPEDAIAMVQSYYKIPAEKLTKALSRTRYFFLSNEEMQSSVETYYQTIGKPLNENFADFYYISAQ